MPDQDPLMQPQPSPQPVPVPPGQRKAVVFLSIAVVIQAIMILGLIAALGVTLWNFGAVPWGMGGPDEEMFALTDQVSSDVGYLLEQRDVEGFMDLYDASDTHVDLAKAREDFVRAASETTGTVDYMGGMEFSSYVDKKTDETVLEMTISGVEPYSGMPRGPRLRVYVVQTEDGWRLTGRTGRTLEMDSSGGW